MENSQSYTSNSMVRSMTMDSRTLCVVCGANAIGMNFKLFKLTKIFIKISICNILGRNFDAYTCLSCKGN